MFGALACASPTFQCSQHSETLHLCARSHLAPTWAARPPLGCPRALQWAARAPLVRSNRPLGRHLGAQGRSNGPLGRHLGAQGRSNGPLGRHLGAQGRSNGPLGRHLYAQIGRSGALWSHWAVRPETSAHVGTPNALFCARRAQLCALGVLWPCSVRARCSKPAVEPLCVRNHCSKSLFEITVRGSCLITTVLCFTSLCFPSVRACLCMGSH